MMGLGFADSLAPQDRGHARSMVITQGGIVATSHVLASQAGAQVLARGGSAVDAAIAANAVLSVTEPMMCGIGGDFFALYWDANTGKLSGINASGYAPKRLTPEFLAAKDITTMPARGIHSVTVPGAVDGWAKMHARYGKLPWKTLFGAAIYYAEHGAPVPEMIAANWPLPNFESFTAESNRVFAPGGKAPATGDVFRNPDFGRVLRLLADQGRDVFYRGEIARAILTTSEKLGGTIAPEDLAEFSSEWVEPISTTYRGWKVYELPPNGQGMAALQILNLLEQFQPVPGGPASFEEIHKRIEATKLAYADLRAYNADPKFAPVPVEGLLSKEYAQERAKLFDPAKATCDVQPGTPHPGNTVYLTVVDREGNIVSWIQSIAARWGSGITVDGMGFILHNRGSGFVLEPKHPDVLAPRKRPYHTIIPAFMEKGDLHLGFGIMGGLNQPLAHAQYVSNFVDFGQNLQAALETPRFTKQQHSGCQVMIESRVPQSVRTQLKEAGHQLTEFNEYGFLMGRGQAVLHDAKTKVNYGASDPRGDGSAEPEPPPVK
jgi:gamma-glutamyltranspeptidase / glutathione hydrolase